MTKQIVTLRLLILNLFPARSFNPMEDAYNKLSTLVVITVALCLALFTFFTNFG
jgi:hypothetical protein